MSDNNEKYKWMRWLCDPVKREDQKVKNRGLGDDGYALSIHPVAVAANGQPWVFASNGAASLLVRDHVNWRAPSEGQALIIQGFIQKEIRGKLYPLPAFRRWLGRGWKSALPCEACDGNWSRNCHDCFGIGIRAAKCADCGSGHDCACSKCGGEGVVFCNFCVGVDGFEKKPGHYRDVVFDRAMLARFLAHVEDRAKTDTVVRIMADNKAGPVWVEDKDHAWRVAIMPLREPEASSVSGWGR